MPSFLRPIDLEAMRFNQLRSKNLIQAPWNLVQVVDENRARRPLPALTLPQAMAQNKWKTPGRGYDNSYAGQARSVAELAGRFGTPAPMKMMQPVPFYPQSLAARTLNRIPPMRKVVSVPEPVSRGVLQRGPLEFVNQEELRAAARHMNHNLPGSFTQQTTIASRTFPSTYVFDKYRGQHYYIPGQQVNGVRTAPMIYTPRTRNGRR